MSVVEFPRDDESRGPDYASDRTPPNDIAAEQSVLGAMLLSKDAIADVVELVREGDFYRPAHQVIYGTILDLYGRGEPADAVTVVLFHDHGSRYVGKIYNDDWMRERGFLEEELLTAADLVAKHGNKPLVSLYAEELVSHAIAKMRNFDISQIPVMKDGKFYKEPMMRSERSVYSLSAA